MKFLKTIFLIINFLFFLASCSSSSGDSSAASNTPTINISGNSTLSINQGNLRLRASGSIEKINDTSIDFYLGGEKQGSNAFSVATSDNNGIIITFSSISLIEKDASVLLSQGAFIIGGVESEEKIINFVIDTKPPTASSTPSTAAGTFDATVTFHEQVYNNSSSAIDENNFTLSGFADNDITPIITISNGRTVALFNNLSFAAADSLTATISLSNIRDGVGNLLAATSLSIYTLLGAIRSGNCSGIDFDGGSGVSSNPYQISNLCQLQNIATGLSADYELTTNIDASWTRGWNNGAGFSPIGNNSNPFTGNFNGNDYLVDALFIYRPTIHNLGFFGWTIRASISNARLTKVDIQGNSSVGGLVGINTNNSNIQNSSATGSVSGNQSVGGLVGINTNNSNIQNSSSASTTQGNQSVGGLVGINTNNSTIQNSSSASSVFGNLYVGGLIGSNVFSGTTQNSSSAGSAQGNQYVGGLIGENTSFAIVQNSFSAGSVQGNQNVGGLIGYNFNSTTTNSYWNFETSGQSSSSGGSARSTQQFLDATSSLFNDSAWGYGNSNSYPTLTQNVMDATTQALHQVAGMIRLADAAGTDFFGATNLQNNFTMDEANIPSVQDATVFALDVNAEAPNDSSRVDFWDCATGSGNILLTTSSINGTSVTLQYGEENTITAAFEKATGGSCAIVRTNTGTVQEGDVLHLEAVISKGSGLDKRSYTHSFKLTLE